MNFNFNFEDYEFVLRPVINILPIVIYFIIAYIVIRKAKSIAARLRPIGDLAMRGTPRQFERMQTIQALIASAIRVITVIVVVILTLSIFVSLDTLVWMVGLFSAAFGLGARPYIADLLGGVMLIFEDTYDVGHKVEFPATPHTVIGVVEEVNLRITRVRGMDGELYTMPNGDVRLVRNFSRGDFSSATVKLTIPAAKLPQVLQQLDALNESSMTRLTHLIEPWRVVSETGELSETAQLTIVAKARFGKGAELRTRLLALFQTEIIAHLNDRDHAAEVE